MAIGDNYPVETREGVESWLKSKFLDGAEIPYMIPADETGVALGTVANPMVVSGGSGGGSTTTVPKGYTQITSLAAATGLGTIPTGATVAKISVEGAPVRFREDGVSPTTTVGDLLNIGDQVTTTALSAIKFIQITSGAILNVRFEG